MAASDRIFVLIAGDRRRKEDGNKQERGFVFNFHAAKLSKRSKSMTGAHIPGNHGVSLRTLDLSMASAMATIANDKEVAKNLRDIFPFPYSYEDAIAFINFVVMDKVNLSWPIFFRDDLAGMIGLVRQGDVYSHSAEIGYWLGSKFQGKGVATEAIRLVCDCAFNELRLLRLFAGVFEPNYASQKVLLKNGFVIEGIKKNAVMKDGVLMDEVMMAKCVT
jgi:RimJ/RimL family protein N-acetyltransferase